MEQLLAFIKTQPDRTDQDWAKWLHISRSHFTMLRLGTALPSRKLAAHIEVMTQGAVPRSAWDTDDGQPPNAKARAA